MTQFDAKNKEDDGFWSEMSEEQTTLRERELSGWPNKGGRRTVPF